MSDRVRVLLLRGQYVNPWDLRPWGQLPDRFDVASLVSPKNVYATEDVPLERVPVRTLRDYLPRGTAGDVVAGVVGERYFRIEDELRSADIVHASELSFWFAAEAAKHKPKFGYKLVLTAWETIPFLDTYRNKHARRYRQLTLPAADLFLAATERAREALLLEGVEPERIQVCYPGIDVERFGVPPPDPPPGEHVIVSPGRLVWEKGHQDVMRAIALLRHGIVPNPAGTAPRLLVVGSGPEEKRLHAYAEELGIADLVEFRSLPYEEMPQVYAEASCLVLGSLPAAGCSFYLGDLPRCFWEEQFGLVFAEAMAAGLPIITTTSGAIPEVVGDSAELFAPGDWVELARKLAAGPLSKPPATRVEHPPDRVRLYSTSAMAERLASAYDRVLASASS
jgi:glycosyltransferase involved in cell wall biosynthesis